MQKKWLSGILFMIAAAASAFPPGVTVEPAGNLTICGLSGGVIVFNKNWQQTKQSARNILAEPGYPVPSEKVYEHKGVLKIPGTEGFTFQQWVKEKNSSSATYSMKLRNRDGISCQTVVWSLELPASQFEGRSLQINGKPAVIRHTRPIYHVKELILPVNGRKIILSGDFTLQIQDNRSWSVPSFSMRFMFTPGAGKIRETNLAFTLSVESLHSVPMDLSRSTAGKRSGKEMAEILRRHGVAKGGGQTVGSIPFQLGDVRRKTGTLLELDGNSVAELPVNAAKSGTLYLLHSADNASAAPRIHVTYADGSTQEFLLKHGTDFSTKRPLPRLPNGAAAAVGNKTFDGFYFSAWALPEKAVRKLAFENTGKGKWFIAAGTIAESSVRPDTVESVFFVTRSAEWVPMEQVRPVVKGSILDFRFLQDAPAGKYGWITADANGHFTAEKANGKRFRFFGPNLCFSAQYLEKADAEKLADELASFGYTVVRFHHYDNMLVKKNGKNSTELDPERLDRLDYLFACLKKRGIYLTLDLYCSRVLLKNELPPIDGLKKYAMKQLLPVYAPARENWKQFVRNLLTHKNPYTGMKWGDDPALFCVSLSNENITLRNWNGPAKELYLNGYKEYLRKKSRLTEDNLKARNGLFFRYLADLNIDMICELSSFLRKEIGYKGLITEINFQQNGILAEIRDSLDFVDNHQYWDHPNFLPGHGWSFPFLHNQVSALKSSAWNPRTIMPSRIFGKPFTVTEINYVFPNGFRAESGPVLGAYASLQDWDGLYRFSWSHNESGVQHKEPINRFDIAEDSLSHVAERITALMFLRGDVQAAPKGVAWPFGSTTFRNLETENASAFPINFEMLGFFCKIGTLRENKSFPGVKQIKSMERFMQELSPAEQNAIKNPVKTSMTGEITYDTKTGTLKVVAPKTESLSFFRDGLRGGVLSVDGASPVFQIVTASAMDGKALKQSRDILVFHQTDVTNEYLRYSTENRKAVEHWGTRKPLIRRANARVALRLDSPERLRIQAIGLDGMPKGEIPVSIQNGALVFSADTASLGGTMIYRISTKQ